MGRGVTPSSHRPSSLGRRGEPEPVRGENDSELDVKPALLTNGAGARKGVGARRSGKGLTAGYERLSQGDSVQVSYSDDSRTLVGCLGCYCHQILLSLQGNW
jgi:hypothetical protein